MTRLAECSGHWLLVKIQSGGVWGYWVITPDLQTNYLSFQTPEYGAVHALAYIEITSKQKATWVRPVLSAC